jgi:hypothetical protein
MARVSNYNTDGTLNADDKWIGTDGAEGAENGKTKNYTVQSVLNYVEANLNQLTLTSAANDSAAASAGVPVGGLYHTSGTLKIRLT